MHFISVLALAAAPLAYAQNSTFSWSSTPGPGSPGPTDAPGTGSQPKRVGPFKFYGCGQSTDGFSSLSLAGSSKKMSLDFCAASCSGDVMGVYDTDCYCGPSIDKSTTTVVDADQCDTSCPGDEEQNCGGQVALARLRRANVPVSVLLSLYVRVGNGGGNGPTLTKTITSTTTGTITTCPPEVTDCPMETGVTTITSAYCPEETSSWYQHQIVCYGDYCTPAGFCDECAHHRVVCRDGCCWTEECDQSEWHKLVICEGESCHYANCEGDECNKKVVCYNGVCEPEECWGEECQKKFVCNGDQCEHQQCSGDDCYTHEVCHEGEECHVQPPCTGPECPVPPPPAPMPTPEPPVPSPNHTIPPPPPPPVGAGSGNVVPAVGMLVALVAGLAAL